MAGMQICIARKQVRLIAWLTGVTL